MGNQNMTESSQTSSPTSLPIFLNSSQEAQRIINTTVLSRCKNRVVVLSGCGGGCDVFGAAYLFNQVKNAGARKVVLANLSFTSKFNLHQNGKCVLDDLCYKIMPNAVDFSAGDDAVANNPKLSNTYFPEAMMATAVQHPVYAFRGGFLSVQEIADCHRAILREEGLAGSTYTGNKNDGSEENNNDNMEPETALLFLVDGGFDAFLDGTETGLATPVEDMMHIKAAQSLMITNNNKNNKNNNKNPHHQQHAVYDGANSLLCAIGGNVDCAHGMVQSEMIERLVALKKTGALIVGKTLSVVKNDAATANDHEDDEHAQFYCQVVKQCCPVQTIVQSLAVAAIEGHRGLYTPPHLVPRIGRNKIPLSELTSTFFIFDFNKVADDIKYLHAIEMEFCSESFQVVLAQYRKSIGKR